MLSKMKTVNAFDNLWYLYLGVCHSIGLRYPKIISECNNTTNCILRNIKTENRTI